MRVVYRVFSRRGALSAVCAILISSNILAADIRPRDPSFGERIKELVRRVVRTLSDNIIIPPA
jgi:hypothetical protein